MAATLTATLTATLLIFLASLLFTPVRLWMFPPDVIASYPLFCTAEPTVDAVHQTMIVEFYIVNRQGIEYTRERLVGVLEQGKSDPSANPQVDIVLQRSRPVGTLASAAADTVFNADKGTVTVRSTGDDHVIIGIERIEPRAILRVLITLTDMPDLNAVSRGAKTMIPFAFSDYQDACYTR